MRRLRYSVAASLDGFIAGPNGEYDWIIPGPTIDFAALFDQFDTWVMGRRTYELVLAQGPNDPLRRKRLFVASRSLKPSEHPGVTLMSDAVADTVSALKNEPSGKDIWLFGGGVLFRTLLDAGLVDTIGVALVPILLGNGIPLLARGQRSSRLRLLDSKVLPSGTLMLIYQPGRPTREGTRAA